MSGFVVQGNICVCGCFIGIWKLNGLILLYIIVSVSMLSVCIRDKILNPERCGLNIPHLPPRVEGKLK